MASLSEPAEPRLVVVVGGASGLACALTAARSGIATIVLERMDRCGSKLAVTGGGRGNLTHADAPRSMAAKFDCKPRLLAALFRRFPYQRIVKFLSTTGVECRVDEDGCVWAAQGGAPGVRDALVLAARKAGVRILTGTRALGIEPDADGWRVETAAGPLRADFLCVATGGASYPGTGSSGDGLGLCSALGMATTGWFPALCSLQPRQPVADLAGVTQPSVGMALSIDAAPMRRATGHFIFAHRYVSGSAVLNLSGHAARALTRDSTVKLEVDWVPGRTTEELTGELARAREAVGRRMAANWLTGFVARRLADHLVADAGIPAGRRMADLTRAEHRELARALKRTVYDIVGTEPIERATVTGGGVALDEIDLSSGEARRFPGLYVTGELLDTWAETGGYNLHLAWASGIAAGESVAGRLGAGGNA